MAPIAWDGKHKLGETPEDDAACRRAIAELRYKGIYTPPSLNGTLQYPSNLGGVNRGRRRVRSADGILYANTNRYFVTVR